MKHPPHSVSASASVFAFRTASTSTHPIRRLLATLLFGVCFAIATTHIQGADPTGKIVFYQNVGGSNTFYQIFIINGNGTGLMRINHPSEDESYPALSPDGTQIAFTASTTNNSVAVFLMNTDGSNVAQIPNTEDCAFAAWSADGTKLAAAKLPFGQRIVTFNVDGSQFQEITSPANNGATSPTWSPDGTKIAFDARNSSGTESIFIVNADGSNTPTQLSIDANSAYRNPSWSPSGQKIACDKNGVIYTLDAVTGAEARITPLSISPNDSDLSPSWSPDGTQLAFQSYADGAQLALMNATDGSNRHAYQTAHANSPKWSPARILPRIVSGRTATATVGLFFTYHTLVNSFDPGASITFSATGLPDGLTIDPKSGIISGEVSSGGGIGSPPIIVTLHATDGTFTANFTLTLTIGDSIPVFTVNGSKSPASGLADTTLSFVAQQDARPIGRSFHIEASTDGGATWQNLPNGTGGHMTFDLARLQFVLNSTNYPQGSVSFRAVSHADGYPDGISNIVGPFDFAGNTPRASQTALRVIPNGLNADLDFRSELASAASGVLVNVQSSQTPAIEGSWANLPGGSSGQMIQQPGSDPNKYVLLTDNLPPAGGIYFRVRTDKSGATPGLSNVVGPYTLTADSPPAVTISSPSSNNGLGQDPKNPIIVTAGQLAITVNGTAGSNRSIVSLRIFVDGSPVAAAPSGSTQASINYPADIGGHTIEAIAIDDLGAIGRAGTNPLFIQVNPPVASGARKEGVAAVDQAGATSAGGKVFRLVKDGGRWTDAATWSDSNGGNGVPGATDLAIMDSLTVRLPDGPNDDGQGIAFIDIGALDLRAGEIVGNVRAVLQVKKMITISGGDAPDLNLSIGQGATCEMINDLNFAIPHGTISNDGTLKLHGRGGIVGLTEFDNHGTSDFQMPLIFPPVAGVLPALGERQIISEKAIQDASLYGTSIGGSLVATGGGNVVSHDGGSVVSHDGGSVVSHDGGSLVPQGGGNVVSHDGGSLISQDGGGLVATGGGNVVSHDGGSLVAQGGGNLVIGASGNRQSRNAQAAATPASGFVQSAGETNLNFIKITGPVTLDGGTLSGSGIIEGDLTNNGGFISAGHSAGTIVATGNFTQGTNGTLIVENGGDLPTDSDQLMVLGAANLGGKLDVRTINGYVPDPRATFVPLNYGSVSGSFAFVSGNAQVTLTPTGPLTTVDPAKPNPPNGQPTNISTRMKVLTNDNVLIGGFIVSGPSGSTKKVLIHGLGPSLSSAGLSGLLSDPFLEFHYPDGTVITNDNWGDAPNKDQIPNGFAPKDPKESIIIADLSPGVYTVIVKGAHGETGIGMTEIYDIDGSTGVALTNVSTRGYVDTGDNVMIGGFIVGGSEPATMLVRVAGPSLKNPPASLRGVLEDPTLELHDANGSVISNDNWRETQESEITATTMAPKDDKEPAILATLVPGVYTAIVRGKDNTTGIAIVEAFKIK